MLPRRSARTSALVSAVAATVIVRCATPGEGSHPTPPLNHAQRNSDGTPLGDAGVPNEGPEIELTASSGNGTCGSNFTLEFEVLPTAQAFTGVPTHISALFNKPTCNVEPYPFTKIVGLTPSTAYHWRARENSLGSTGTWVAFNGGATAFTTAAPPALQMAFT